MNFASIFRSKKSILIFVGILILMTLILRLQQSGFGKGEVLIDNKLVLPVAVAGYDGPRAKGLGGCCELDDNQGMLFVFSEPQMYQFWMKDMKIPIDVIWAKDGQIVDLTYNIQPPSEGQDGRAISFLPIEPADTVIEVPAGYCAQNGLRIGLPVSYRIDKRGRFR